MTGALAAGVVIVAMVTHVVDGDTIRLADRTVVRFSGIAAPELNKPGGKQSRAFVLGALRDGRGRYRQVHCVADGYQSWKREVMACAVDGLDIGRMIQEAGQGRACHVRGALRRYDPKLDKPGAEPRNLPGYCK